MVKPIIPPTARMPLDEPAMKFQQLIILLPCHSLEDFPQHHCGEDAAGLLACWTALWHPALLCSADAAPLWYRADDPPQELTGSLLLVPSVSEPELPVDFAARAEDEGAYLLTSCGDRQALLEQAWAHLDGGDAGVDPDLAADFLALGYGFLQIQILTRQMRYSSSLDEAQFNGLLVTAAKAAVAGEADEARSKLSACFDLLAEERDHYYAVDAFVLDLTVLAASTLGEPLTKELAGPDPVNLLLSGQTLEAIAQQCPETLAALKEALGAGRVGLVGGEDEELCLPLLSCETILAALRRGLANYEKLLERRVDIFGRRRFGLTPLLPQILGSLGFSGACHATLDDGRFPEGSQIKTRWEGADGTTIDALAKAPLDAGKPETFLCLGTRLGESMDTDHVATLWLAHWPGGACPWYEDLRRCARFSSALGRFLTIEAYFRDTYVPGHVDRFDAGQYRSPYLRQAVDQGQVDPISRFVRYWHCRALVETAQTLGAMLAALGQAPDRDLDDLKCEADRGLETDGAETLVDRLVEECEARLAWFAEHLPVGEDSPQDGYLLVNACSFVQRLGAELPELPAPPDVSRPVYAVGENDGQPHAVVDVPAQGFVWVTEGSGSRASRPQPRLAEDQTAGDGRLLLRNEFFEAWIHPETGALHSLKDYHSRGSRLAQRLVFREGVRGGEPRGRVGRPEEYSGMVADSVDITLATSAVGEIVARGRLVDNDGNPLAGFRQTWRVWRGSRVLQLEIELDPHAEPGQDPWASYYACRFAWADEAAELSRSVHLMRRPCPPKRIESPHYVEIDSADTRTAILCGGLPFHRRVGFRMLDSLLIVHGERARVFRLGVGIDLKHPIHQAWSLLVPPLIRQRSAPPPATSGWFFHLDARNVVATHWSPLCENGQCVGLRTRLLETSGRSAKTRLSCCRPIREARMVNFLGQTSGDCRLEEGCVQIELSANQWVELEARWQ